MTDKLQPIPVQSGNNNFLLDVHTYILVLECGHVDFEKNTCNVWVELGFCYDVHDFFRTFDIMVTSNEKSNDRTQRLKNVTAEEMQIPFDIVNAITRDQRSEAHFIRETNGFQPGNFYTESDDFNKHIKATYLSDAKNLVNTVDISKCPRGKYWKHETRTFNLELTFRTTERLAPFDQIHMFFKLITANCQPGTNRIKFVYNEVESDFSGMKHAVAGYHPITNKNGIVDPVVNNAHSFSNSIITWDRLYISVAFKKKGVQEIVTYYIVPFLLFNYMIIGKINYNTEALLGISSTLVIANVALLIVSQNNVFTFYEQAVLTQIVVLIIATLLLAYLNDSENMQSILALSNFAIFCLTLGAHSVMAKFENAKIHSHIRNGRYSELNTI